MISVKRLLSVKCLDMIKAKYFGHETPHPWFNPNPISRYYVAAFRNQPIMLATVNLDDKVYINSIVNVKWYAYTNDGYPLFRSPRNIKTLVALIDDIMNNFQGETVFTCNSPEFIDSVCYISENSWISTHHEFACLNTNDYNKNYSFMHDKLPDTICTTNSI